MTSIGSRFEFRTVPCPVCGSWSFDPVAVGQAFPPRDGDPTFLVGRCTGCATRYLNPRPIPEGDSERHHAPEADRSVGTAAIALARDGPAFIATGRPDLEAARREDAVESPAAKFGAVYLAGAHEVDPDPTDLLRRARDLVDRDGELVVLGANADSNLMRVFGRRHASLYAFPNRNQLYGHEAIGRLAEAAGFEVIRTFTLADARAWRTSIRNFVVDWGASPFWIRRIERSLVLRGILALLETTSRAAGRGALLGARLRPDERRPTEGFPADRAPAISAGTAPPVFILGAGVAGLTAAQQLRHQGVAATLFEAAPRIAGLAGSFRDEDGFSHDFGAHFITNRFAAALGIGAVCRTVKQFGEAVRLDGATYAYPFGLLRSPRFVLSATLSRLENNGAPESAAELYRQQFGRRLADEVALPLVEAWSGVSADELAPSVSPPQLDRGIAHVLRLKASSRLSGRAVANGFSRVQPENPHVFHVYPETGLSVLTERLADGLGDSIRLESRVERIYVEEERVRAIRVNGEDLETSAVISTAPVHILPRLVAGSAALDPFRGFRYRPFSLVNLRFDTRPVLPEVCVWIPGPQYTFFRLTEAPLAMPWLAPVGKTIVTADIGCEVGDRIWTMEDEALGELCVDELEDLFPGVRSSYLGCHVLRTPVAHPVYLRENEAHRIELERGLPIDGLLSVGRNGEFAHILMEDVYWRTRERVQAHIDRGRPGVPLG